MRGGRRRRGTGSVKWSIQTPNMGGIDAASELAGELRRRREAAEVVDRADHRRDRGAQQHAAALAREIEESERRNEDAEEDREPAEPRDRASVEPARVGLVDGAEHARHAADRGREEDDDDEGDRRLRRGPPASPAARRSTTGLLRAVQAVACVAEAREDVALLVQAAVDRGDDDRDVRVVARARARCPRAPRSAR